MKIYLLKRLALKDDVQRWRGKGMINSVGIIMKNALKERMRRKEMYIIVVIAILLILFCSSDTTSITIDGEAVTGFSNMFMVMHTLVHGIGCILAVVLSLKTIPNEYERRNSHLVWVRKISQREYHGGLVLANILASLAATGILYFVLAVYAVVKGHAEVLLSMFPAFLILAVSVSFVSLFVSVLSIRLPVMAAAVLGVLVLIFGVFHGVMDIFKSMLGGVGGKCLSVFLQIVPDLNGIQKVAYQVVMGKGADAHIIFIVLFALWIASLGLFVFKKKEA